MAHLRSEHTPPTATKETLKELLGIFAPNGEDIGDVDEARLSLPTGVSGVRKQG